MGTGYFSSIQHHHKYYQEHIEEKHAQSKIYNKKIKNTPKYKNKLQRQYERAKELRQLSLEIGNCTCCFKPIDDPRYHQCIKCREKNREYAKKLKEKKCH